MKRLYLLQHLAAILIYLIFTYLAFVMVLPAYLLAVWVGFELWQRLVRPGREHNFTLSVIVLAVTQAVTFVAFVLGELTLFGLHIYGPQLNLVGWFSSFVFVGFLLVAFVTTAARQRTVIHGPKSAA